MGCYGGRPIVLQTKSLNLAGGTWAVYYDEHPALPEKLEHGPNPRMVRQATTWSTCWASNEEESKFCFGPCGDGPAFETAPTSSVHGLFIGRRPIGWGRNWPRYINILPIIWAGPVAGRELISLKWCFGPKINPQIIVWFQNFRIFTKGKNLTFENCISRQDKFFLLQCEKMPK